MHPTSTACSQSRALANIDWIESLKPSVLLSAAAGWLGRTSVKPLENARRPQAPGQRRPLSEDWGHERRPSMSADVTTAARSRTAPVLRPATPTRMRPDSELVLHEWVTESQLSLDGWPVCS